jgi:tetratricopeptide (TPR) repeat protein
MIPLESSLEDRLINQTEGNPLFAVQLLQHWVDQGYVQSGRRGFEVVEGWGDRLPSDLVELWEGRIERLEELSADPARQTIRQSLELAAAQGRSVETSLWREACSRAGFDVGHQLVDQLIARGLALETKMGWEFAHGLLVESLQRRAETAGRWTDHHRIWADVLADEPSRGDGRLSARRAEHLLAAGDGEAALEPLMQTARRRGLLGNMTERYEALTRRQQVLDDLGVPTDDRRRVENETHMSAHMIAEERNEEARAVASRAYRLATDHGWHLIQARTLKTLAECAKDEGDYQSAVDKLDEAIDAAKHIDDHRLVAALYADQSWLSLIQGDTERARTQLRECLVHAERVSADYWIVNAKYQMGQVEMSAGNREAAESFFNEALASARRHGLQRLEALCINSLGDFAKEDGDWKAALTRFEQFDQIASAVQIGRLSLLARLNMAQVHAVRGNTAKANQLTQAVSRHLAAGDITDHEGLIDVLRLVVAIHKGDLDRAISLFSSYAESWPENQRLDHDIPWMFEQAVDIARGKHRFVSHEDGDAVEPGGETFVRALADRARELYVRLGDDSSAERLQRVIADL